MKLDVGLHFFEAFQIDLKSLRAIFYEDVVKVDVVVADVFLLHLFDKCEKLGEEPASVALLKILGGLVKQQLSERLAFGVFEDDEIFVPNIKFVDDRRRVLERSE